MKNWRSLARRYSKQALFDGGVLVAATSDWFR